MREEELDETQVCVVCGEEIDPEDGRDFWVSASTVSCYECARKHGGVYDPELEKWKTPPRLPSIEARMPEED